MMALPSVCVGGCAAWSSDFSGDEFADCSPDFVADFVVGVRFFIAEALGAGFAGDEADGAGAGVS